MEANYSVYDHEASDDRIREILDSAESFEERDDIPSRDELTYSNGFYVRCTALFIDIRGSSELAAAHTRPVLGKLYRAYLSECVAVMNGNDRCREVFINGDCVSGVFSTPYKSHIDGALETAARLHSVAKLLNWRLEQKDYKTFRVGIGMSYGRALMLQAGYKGSGIKDVIWMGDVMNEASNLCHEGSRGMRDVVQVATVIYDNMKDDYKRFFRPVPAPLAGVDHYEANVVNAVMEAYLNELQEKAARQAAMVEAIRSHGVAGMFGAQPRAANGLLADALARRGGLLR